MFFSLMPTRQQSHGVLLMNTRLDDVYDCDSSIFFVDAYRGIVAYTLEKYEWDDTTKNDMICAAGTRITS